MKKALTKTLYRPGPYLLSSLMFVLVLGLGAFVVNEVAFFNEGFPLDRMNDVEFYATFFVFVLAFFSYLVFGKYRFRYAEPWWLDVLLLSFLSFGAVGIFLYPEETLMPNGYVFVVDLPNKLRSFACLFTSVSTLYSCLVIGPRTTRANRFSLFVATIAIVIGLTGVIYSAICEREVFAHFFSSTGNMSSQVLQSFTNNRNTFGMLLLFAIGASALWNSHRPSFFWYLLMGLFAFTLVFVLSKTSILLSVAFLLCYFIYRFIATFKSRPVRNIFFTLLLVGGGTTLGLASFTSAFDGVAPEFSSFMKNFLESVSKYGTFDARLDIWELCFAELNTPLKLWFGIGYRNVNAFLYATHFGGVGYNDWTHNGFVDLLMRNGLAGILIASAIMIAFLAYLSLTLRKENSLAVTFALLVIFFGGHGMTETTDFFSMDAKSIFLVLMTLYPAFSDFYRRQYGLDALEKTYYLANPLPRKVRYELSPIRIATRFLTVLFPLLVAGGAILLPLGEHYNIRALKEGALPLTMLAVYLILPYLFYSLSYLKKGKRFFNGIIPVLLCLSGLPLAYLPYGYYGLIPPLCALFGVALRTKNLKGETSSGLFKKVYLPFASCAFLSFMMPHILDPFYKETSSLFLFLPCLFTPIIIFFLFFEGSAYHESAYIPYKYREARFEARIHARGEAFDLKCRQRRFLDRLSPLDRKAERARYKKERTFLFTPPLPKEF